MSDKNEKIKPIKFIRDICKGKTKDEMQAAEENFREYLMVIKGICDRLEDEGELVNFDGK